ncbi:MAG TPA: T9SS type A sorting domain-containing protein, partial [Cytophagaceae bacterium]|nr:T9SS type A sorting domain-containing protein [Cytophagaceae bacterium]
GTASQPDWAIDLALDGSDNAYITGRTQTTAGFSTAGAFMTVAGGGYDAYILKINFAGTLGYCTYIGGAGNDIAKGITMTSTNEALIVGMTLSAGMASAGAFQTTIAGADDAFLFKLSNTGAARVFCTYMGGIGQDGAASLDLVLPSNEPIIVGTTSSSDFPVLNAVDGVYNNGDGMIARFKADGSALKYSSYIGGDGTDNQKGYDYTTVAKFGGIKVVAGKPVIVMGMASTAASMATFLVNTLTYTAYNQMIPGTYTFNTGTYSGGPLGDILVVVFDSVSTTTPTVLFGSYFGGTSNDYPTAGVNVDPSSGCVVFGGGVHSEPFPVTVGSFETSRVNNTVNDQPAIAKVCLASILLPVDFLNFNVREQNGIVAVDWSTATETNNSYFEILKSTDGKTFYSIGRVEGSGTTYHISSYNFIDQQPSSGISYYKIKQVDVNGDYMFSTIRSVNIQSFGDIQITPNPGNGQIKIKTSLIADANLEIIVISTLGEKIYGSKEKASKGTYEKDINIQNFASGIYLVQIISGNEVKTVKYVKE